MRAILKTVFGLLVLLFLPLILLHKLGGAAFDDIASASRAKKKAKTARAAKRFDR